MKPSNKIYYVYEHRELDTGRVFYVGKGKGRRAYDRWGRNPHWKRIVAKHGYSVHKLFENLSEHDAFNLERLITDAYGIDDLAVMVAGGSGTNGFKHSDATKLAMSINRTGKMHSESTRRMMSIASLNNADKMRKLQELWLSESNPSKREVNRIKSSERMIKCNPSNNPETVRKIQQSRKGFKHTEENKRHLSFLMSGDKHPMWGTIKSAETCSKMREGNRWRMRAVRTACGLTFDSTKSASIATGARQGNIVNCCKGRTKSAGGYQWEYVT